ncbi:MAG TPA: hypothetical protein EYP59_22495, partial [Thiotrichaceae bacterium]|nr:hypothetical protein [Thiotrichaceae bacterium]
MSKITLLLISLFVFQNIQATEIQARLALLIGNSDYKGEAFLANPVNDAQDLAEVLSDLQFQVSHRQNLTRAEMNSAIEEFGQNLKATKGMGIFYYAGHGMQVGGENYLIPIGGERALFKANYKLDKNTIKASNILKTLEAADNAVNVIILDACRNNPFPKTRGISRRPTPPGLQMMNAPGGSLIAYSADQGEVAFEGKNKRNSPYAASLIQQIKDNPNSSLLQLFTKVRADVFQKTGEFQAPGFYSKLNQDYCLMGACSKDESSIDLGELIQQVAHLWQPILAVMIAFGVLWLGWRRNLVGAVVTTFVEYRAGKIERKRQLEITRRKQAEIRQKRQAEVESEFEQRRQAELEQRRQAEIRQRRFEAGQRRQAGIVRQEKKGKIFGFDVITKNWQPIVIVTAAISMAWIGWQQSWLSSVGTWYESLGELVAGQSFRDSLQIGGYGPEMVVIPAGRFQMGDIQGGGDDDEKPVHWVNIDYEFAMGKYEITNAEFVQFLNAVKHRGTKEKPWFETKDEDSDSHITGSVGNFRVESDYDNHPVIEVSWYGAIAYAEWLTQQTGEEYRLPSEAEWEYAARAGTETKYWWGNDIGKNKANCDNDYCGDNFEYTSPVGSFSANQFGLYDTVGNVWEWTCSVYEYSYQGAEQRCASSGSLFVLRGGSWFFDAMRLRSTFRFRDSADFPLQVLRCAALQDFVTLFSLCFYPFISFAPQARFFVGLF